jgi:hypothetical protein
MRRTILLRIGYCLLAGAVVFSWGREQMKVTTEDGVVVVKNGRLPSPPAGGTAKLVLEPVFAIGGEDDPEQEFSGIVGIAVSKAGTVYILDIKECRVKVFNEKGKFLFSFGNKGQGPGELNVPAGIMISGEEEIFIHDVSNKLEIFNLDGKYLRSQSLAQASGLGKIIIDPKGRIAGSAMTVSPSDGKPSYEFRIFDKDFKPLTILAKVPSPYISATKFDPLTNAPGLAVATDAKGDLFLGNIKGYLISVFNFEGRLLRTIKRDYVPVPILKSDQEEFLKLYEKSSGQYAAIIKDMMIFPDYYPAYFNIIANPDGQLLVQTFEKGPEAKTYFHDVFDQDGRYFSRIALRMFPVLAWHDEKLFGIEENEEGFQILKCYRTLWEK